MITVRKLGVIAMVVFAMTLAACTSSTSPPSTSSTTTTRPATTTMQATTTTTQPVQARAVTGAARSFVQLADRGLLVSFVGTYRLSGGEGSGPSTLLVAQSGPIEPRFGFENTASAKTPVVHWMYSVSWPDGRRAELFQLRSGIYQCQRTSRASPWSCQGPATGDGEMEGGPGFQGALGAFEPWNQYEDLVSVVATTPSKWIRTFSCESGGRWLRCLTATIQRRTWCLNPKGLVAVFNDGSPRAVSWDAVGKLAQVSYSLPAMQLSLPARPEPWQELKEMFLSARR